MSKENISILDLLKRQEEQRKELAEGSYKAWLPVKEKEDQLLADFDGKYEKALPEIQQQIDNDREDYFEEWSADGRLAVMMTARHEKERERLIEKQKTIDEIRSIQQRHRDNDRGR